MLYIVGLGPGSKDLMTQEALDVIEKNRHHRRVRHLCPLG